MSTHTSTEVSSDDLNAVLEVVNDLARKSATGKYIFRGERKKNPKVSSGLYRLYEDIESEDFDIKVVQTEILIQARGYTRYTGETDDSEILSQLQHHGGATNLIDFTTDCLIALFFACDGEPGELGRVILLSDTGADYETVRTSSPAHRIIAQKSVFVIPNKGFIEPDDTVTIDSGLKPAILDYLRSHHGISTESIYNDLHGFIKHQDIHQSSYTEFYKGLTLASQGEHHQAITHYSQAIELNPQLIPAYNNRGIAYDSLGDYRHSIQNYEAVLALNPEHAGACNNLGVTYYSQGNYQRAIEYYNRALELGGKDDAYCNRGEVWLHLEEWENARADLKIAASEDIDIVASFRNDYADVADFEQRNDIQLPEDLAKMLGG